MALAGTSALWRATNLPPKNMSGLLNASQARLTAYGSQGSSKHPTAELGLVSHSAARVGRRAQERYGTAVNGRARGCLQSHHF